jgi:hypothetical protein
MMRAQMISTAAGLSPATISPAPFGVGLIGPSPSPAITASTTAKYRR